MSEAISGAFVDEAFPHIALLMRTTGCGDLERDKMMDEQTSDRTHPRSPFGAIRAIDYTFRARHGGDATLLRGCPRPSAAARAFVELDRIQRGNTLALAIPGRTASDAPIPHGSASLQLAFKVSPTEVDQCADELVRQGVVLLSPPTNQSFGHRTLFFRDPDGNLLEVYAEI
jgi:catechol 2,3-dioxygenase-like lactoylglutathione lyase family enzyme